ncbi:LPXTG cell wall anchor domain-containing protein, partial [Lactococcus lactis]|uniref:LPXTG cell wall anchor domain-containing protein n=1 Tax=Lactococcus lactis TaxID=1358 RepID=UPI000A728C86
VWTEDLFDEGKNPKTDEPKAKHDDLKDQDQTLTVEKVKKPVTPPSSTTPSSSKPTTPSTTPTETPKVSLPTTGSETGDMIMYGGALAVLVSLGNGVVYYMKKKKSTKEEG